MNLRDFLAVLAISFPALVFAVEPLPTATLLQQCAFYERSPDSTEAISCQSYLQGYMGGAYAMRNAEIVDPTEQQSGFFERATRTRLANVQKRFGLNQEANYCVPAELNINELVSQLNEFALQENVKSELANEFILSFLTTNFTCD